MSREGADYHFSATAIRGGVLKRIAEAPDDELIPLIKEHGRPTSQALALLKMMRPDMIRAQFKRFSEGVRIPGKYTLKRTRGFSGDSGVLLPETVCKKL